MSKSTSKPTAYTALAAYTVQGPRGTRVCPLGGTVLRDELSPAILKKLDEGDAWLTTYLEPQDGGDQVEEDAPAADPEDADGDGASEGDGDGDGAGDEDDGDGDPKVVYEQLHKEDLERLVDERGIGDTVKATGKDEAVLKDDLIRALEADDKEDEEAGDGSGSDDGDQGSSDGS